jgi:hypothetical protein
MNSLPNFTMSTPSLQISDLTSARLERAKLSFNVRRVPVEMMQRLLSGQHEPTSGDVVLARVVELGQHDRLHLTTGHRSKLYLGDEVVVAYGDRYAPSQFEAYVPQGLGPCHLAAGGGLASEVVSANAKMDPATRIEPIGLVADSRGLRINLRRFALPPARVQEARPPVIGVFGTSMDSGKTTALSGLAHGLSRAGFRVACVKVTGTGSSNDLFQYRDAGAFLALDFVDAGSVTTYRAGELDLLRTFETLVQRSIELGAEVVLLEIADGLLQPETALLARHPRVRELLDGVLFTAGDAMGALMGQRQLSDLGHRILALSGIFTMSALGQREARAMSSLPVLSLEQLCDPAQARLLVEARAERVVG